jgi:hypothetical protein
MSEICFRTIFTRRDGTEQNGKWDWIWIGLDLWNWDEKREIKYDSNGIGKVIV